MSVSVGRSVALDILSQYLQSLALGWLAVFAWRAPRAWDRYADRNQYKSAFGAA